MKRRDEVEKMARHFLELGCDFQEAKKFNLAFLNYSKSEKLGNSEAANNLGNLFADGVGCKKDVNKSIHLYKRAVKLGSSAGAYNLGVHYMNAGQKRWSLHWFRVALAMGDEDAEEMIKMQC